MKCVFCELQEIKQRKFIENNTCWAFPTNQPITVGHTLVVPRRCIDKIDMLTIEELKELFEIIQIVKTALKQTFGAEGFNFAWNEEKLAGQSVPHVHIHIVPRTRGDSGIYTYNPREFLYRPGNREETPEKELLKVAKLISKNID